MRVRRVSEATEALVDPSHATWGRLSEERIELDPVPLVLQPSEYTQVKWAELEYGGTPAVRVSAAYNREAVFFHLRWGDPTGDSRPDDMANFPDQAAVMFPIGDDAPISEMGMPEHPVNMWLWRADVETPLYVTATGRGTTMRHHESPLLGSGVYRDGRWDVVVARPFSVRLETQYVVPLAPGVNHKCTFAIWQGSNKERAGLKAYGPVWEQLEMEP